VTMRIGRNILALAAALALVGASFALAPPAAAHHSFSMFDRGPGKERKLVGTVKAYGLTNPHGWFKIVVKDAAGKSSVWSFEMASVAQLKKFGWETGSLKPGDIVTVTYFPLRFGSNGGQVLDVTLSDGRVLQTLAEADRGYPTPTN
jgi:hypothetical protein